jgi:hypothetical protein
MFPIVSWALVPAEETSATTWITPLLARLAYAGAYCDSCEPVVSKVPPAFW